MKKFYYHLPLHLAGFLALIIVFNSCGKSNNSGNNSQVIGNYPSYNDIYNNPALANQQQQVFRSAQELERQFNLLPDNHLTRIDDEIVRQENALSSGFSFNFNLRFSTSNSNYWDLGNQTRVNRLSGNQVLLTHGSGSEYTFSRSALINQVFRVPSVNIGSGQVRTYVQNVTACVSGRTLPALAVVHEAQTVSGGFIKVYRTKKKVSVISLNVPMFANPLLVVDEFNETMNFVTRLNRYDISINRCN